MNLTTGATQCGQDARERQRRAARNLADRLCLGVALTIGGSGVASAQSMTTPADGWQFEITPYIWMSGMKGDVQSGSLPKTSVDVGFSDVLDALDFAFMGAFEARNGRWGILVDALYLKVSDSATASRTGAGPLGATLKVDADVTMEQTMFAVAGAYRVSSGPTMIDVLSGARYMQLDVDADIDASLFGSGGGGAGSTVSRKGDKSWTDPYVGVRVQHPITDRLTVMGYVDVGGFGVGSDSTVQAMAGLSYDFTRTISGKFGYRYLDVDYDHGGFVYDMEMQGVYVGLGFRF